MNARRVKRRPVKRESYLSKTIRTAKIPKASGSAESKWPAFGYSTPGAGSARSAQVTLCGSQKRSFQNQAESAAMLGGKLGIQREKRTQRKKISGWQTIHRPLSPSVFLWLVCSVVWTC